MTKKVGIFAGTFDPIHIGHIAACLDAKQQLELENVTILVEPKPWRKLNITPYDVRYEMAVMATQQHPDLLLQYSEQERFTVASTLPSLLAQNEGCNLYYLVGADEFTHIPDWEGAEVFVKSVAFAVALRQGQTEATVAETVQKLQELSGVSPSVTVFNSNYPLVSSTLVKAELLRTGHSDSLDPLVEAYIKDNRLYGLGG